MPAPAGPVPNIPDGGRTSTIYGLIRDQQYSQAINILLHELQFHPTSRAALSLLAHCYYSQQDFLSAALAYEHLCCHCPDVADYRFYWAQTLYKSGQYDEALTQCASLSSMQHPFGGELAHLQSMIHYDRDDLLSSQAVLDQCEEDEPVVIGRACLAYKQGKYDQAVQLFNTVLTAAGHANDIAYALAACLYEQGQYSAALKHIGDIIEYGVRHHPELSIGAATDGQPTKAVGNTKTLQSTYLIEAFNLKAAIEITLQNFDHAKESLSDMPAREEVDLDSVTLHNQALVSMADNPGENLKKLNFIISDEAGHFPKNCFHNLLISYLKYEYYDLCADILAENTHLHHLLASKVYEYLECMICIPTNPAEAYRKLNTLGESYIAELRKCTRLIQEARLNGGDTDAIKALLKTYDTTLGDYIPVLMAQCKIYWDLGNYEQVETILKQNAEFCSENESFKLNVGHCFFMQDNKFKEAIKYYELIIHKNYNSVLKIMPIILANLCVSYIMVSENEEAEELMRIIEKEEEKMNQPHQYYHLCIVNLVIGTLYCSKMNFEFGISRIIKSFEPISIKLNTDTWYYAKKNILSVCEYAAKNMLTVKQEMWRDMFAFLDECEVHGAKSKARLSGANEDANAQATNNIAYEARQLKRLMFQLSEQ